MESPDVGTLPRRSPVRWAVAKGTVLAVTLALVLGSVAPLVAGSVAVTQSTPDVNSGHQPSPAVIAGGPVDSSSTSGQWTDPPGQGERNQTNGTTVREKREAAAEAVGEAVTTLQRQGVSVNQSQRAAAVNGTVTAVTQYQNASVAQIQNASYGATTGTFLQSQNVSVEQVQNATFGGASGALSQHQNASATQMQHAAYGATHGAVAQRQNATVEQVQIVAQGAAAGAAHEAGKRERNESRKKAHPGAIREAAQGAAFGALVQTQNVTVEQRQSAAAGAAEGALSQNQSVTVEQRQTASVKQIQVAAMGAAEGALTVEQRQEVTVRQVQAAARGACKGALEQSQTVKITQIQTAAHGAAKGAVSQSQSASIVQIQSAAAGAARGVLIQSQTVSITQIQSAATGAARGAAKSAAQHQVVNVRQIQAAAAGAGQGSVTQIQQINVVQIQIISASAADGALSQSQTASVVQIQSAAQGASAGALSLTQRQEVTVEQTQRITRQAASDTASTAARIDIDVEVTIYNYAKGAAEDPDDVDPDEPDRDEDEDDVRLQSLFASADDDGIFLANPNDVAVTVTVTSDDGDVETVTLAAGESRTLELDRGTYTLTAETSEGEDVELAGRSELTLSVGGELQSLTANVENRTLRVDNPNDQRVTVTLSRNGSRVSQFDVPRDWEVTRILDAGDYTMTAETRDGESVPVNGDSAFRFAVEPTEPVEPVEPAEPADLNVSVSGQSLTVENPANISLLVTVTAEDGDDDLFYVDAGETVNRTLEPGNYTVTGDAEGDREVLVDGQEFFEFTVSRTEAIDLNVSVAGRNVSIDNPSETNVTVTAANETGAETEIAVPASENVTERLAPGNYTLTAESDGERDVLLENETDLNVTVDAAEPPANATLTVENQTGNGTVLVVGDGSATVPYVVAVDYANGSATSESFEANESLDGYALALDPPIASDGSVEVTIRSAATNESLANETIAYDVAEPSANVTVRDQPTDGSLVVVRSATLSEGGFLVVHENSTYRTDDVIGASAFLPPGEHENVTVPLEESLAATTTVNVTAHRDTNENETFDFVATAGGFDEPYVGGDGDPVASATELTVEPDGEPDVEPDVEYRNCTAVRVNGTYDRLAVTLGYYDATGNATDVRVLTAADVPTDRPVDGRTIVTVGETNETTVTADGTLVVQVADPGAFGADAAVGSFIANVDASASPTGDENLSVPQPDSAECREAIKPESPTLGVESIEVRDNETALVNLSYENPNDAPMVPAESRFTNGSIDIAAPSMLEPGQHFVVVEWTPESPAENVVWTVNLSNFDLPNETATGPTAAEVEGLLEPPAETGTATPTATPTPEPTPEDTPTPEPEETPTPEATPEETSTPTPEATPPPVGTPAGIAEATPTPEDTPSPTADATPTPTPGATPTPEDTPTPEPEATPTPTEAPAEAGALAETETPTATTTPSPSPTPSPTPAATPEPTETSTPTPTATPTPTPTPTPAQTETPAPSAAQVSFVPGSAVDQAGNGSLRFDLQNTGSEPATIEQVVVTAERGPYALVYEPNEGDCDECHEMVFRGTDDGYFESGDAGSAYPLGTAALLQDTATLDPDSTLTMYASQFRNNGGQEKDVTGAQLTVTVTYADGSTAEYTFTPS